MIIEWINFISLNLNTFLLFFLYTLSTQPMKREEKRGERAWKECKILRTIGAFFECLVALNLFLWIWFPIPSLNWIIYTNSLVGILLFFIMAIPGVIIILIGNKHAGKESYAPSKETEMYGGIYNYIRHPQTLGEFFVFVAIVFLTNTWFLVVFMIISLIIYMPIMIYYEEKDLIRRFGDSYIEYKKRTSAVFPKPWKRKNK